MFSKNTDALREDILAYFKEACLKEVDIINSIFLKVAKEYKDEDKIGSIDKLLAEDTAKGPNLYEAIDTIRSLCLREIRVFSTAGDSKTSSDFSSLDKTINNLSHNLKLLKAIHPENKNDEIVLQAKKIKLFDELFWKVPGSLRCNEEAHKNSIVNDLMVVPTSEMYDELETLFPSINVCVEDSEEEAL